MFDQSRVDKLATLGTVQAGGKTLETMTESELRSIRDRIDMLLPADSIHGMDMTDELVKQYRRVLHLQEQSLDDEEIAASQKAQVAAQVKSTLQDLVKMQTEFYTSQRFRNIENMIIKFMKSLPLEQAQQFLKDYERMGEDYA